MAKESRITRNVLAATVFLLAHQRVNCQIVGSEVCPSVTVYTGGNPDDLTGTWYENRKYAANSDNVTACTKFTFSQPEPDTRKLMLTINSNTKPRGKPLAIQGTATPIDNTFSKYLVEFIGSKLSPTVYHVLGYSRRNWALIWACSNYEYFHVQQAYVLTYDRIPTKQTVDEALDAAKANDIPRWLFKITDQFYC